ncbi:MAG: ATP-grasp domain-containing protein [Patescibacteria group bacterium]|nr:ATP-grasp domain-containing protein [Patescibacteria group bacterium]
MSDSYLIVLGAGPHQAPVYRTASRLGLKTLALDYNYKAEAIPLADDFTQVSVNNRNAEECIAKLRERGLSYAGVIASGIEASPLASAIADAFGLVWASEKTAYDTTNKCARSEMLQKAGIPIPRFEIINNPALPSMAFPFVVKPSDSSGSRGVRIVRTEDEWEDAYNEALSLSSDGWVVVEEFLQGDEISIEGFVLDGEMMINGFSDRNFISGYEPYFMEDGSTSPSRLPPRIVAEAKALFARAAKALGITTGPSKGDLLVTKEGIKVLEITSRLSPLFPMTAPYTTGKDPLEATIRWATRMDVPRALLEPKFNKAMAHRYFFHQPGKVTAVEGLDGLEDLPGVKVVVHLQEFAVGDVLTPPSYINRLFYIATVAEDRDTAVAQAEDALKTVRITVESV